MSFGKRIFALLPVLIGGLVSGAFAAMEFKEADITTVKNIVERNEGSGAVPAKVSDKIGENSMVSTAASSMAELTFADTSITRMGSNTQFSFKSKERLVKLEQGTLLIHTPPGNGGATVDCGGVTAAVSGTTFMASRDVNGNAMFVLLEGQGGLKVTVGGSSVVIRPGQAASVGAEAIQEAKSSADSGGSSGTPGSGATPATDDKKSGGTGGSGQSPASADGGEGGGTPPSPTAPKIQVFDVDVKKVVTTSPLVTDFKTELPSAAKIEKTIEVQQKSVQEGKLEKLEVEIVAVKSKDGDVLVGAPKPELEEMVVVNKKENVIGAGRGGGGDNVDIDTAAGPGAGGGGGTPVASTPPPRAETPAPAPTQNTPPPVNPGQVAGTIPTTQPSPPSTLALTLGNGTGSLTLDRGLLAANTVSFSGNLFPNLNMASGATTASFSFDPKNYFLGFNFDIQNPGEITSLVGSRSVTVSVAGLSGSALFTHNLAAIRNANPILSLLYSPTGSDLLALDAFFYFTAKAPGVTGGPTRFFSDPAVGGTDRTLALSGPSTQLYPGQNWDLFAARKFTADPGILTVAPSAGKTETAFYGTTMDLGAANPVWQGTQDPRNSSTSLGFRYLTLNTDYLPVFDETLAGTEPTGFFDSFGALLSPLENFPVWDDAGGSISSVDLVGVNLSGSASWNLIAGSGGITARGLDVSANGSAVQMMTSDDLDLKTTRIAGVGPGITGETLVLEAKGKVKMGADGAADLDLPTNAGMAEQQQVRLEAQTDTSGNPLTGNLAVIRTGDSLELRNVTVRGFAETRLEKRNPTTKALEGRVLISGSAVRDFKIKELVGAAVNADAKIQMMALDGNGALAGDMVVAGKMPVQAKVASALAAVGETLPAATANAMVDARQIDLAARSLKFDNANLVAMNSITARASTILIQNSFMTVVRNQGMINMYVQSGLVNTTYGTMVTGRVNFDGLNQFTIGNTSFAIGNQTELNAAYGNTLLDFTQNVGVPQAGKVNVLKL